MKEIRELFVDI